MTNTASVVKIFEVGDYEDQIRRAADLLKQGEVVVLPTETVYGAAAVLTQPAAMARFRQLGPGPQSKPFSIHVARREDAARYLGPVGELGQRMMKKLWPGPVALIFDVPEERQKEAAAQLGVSPDDLYDEGTITLRCPDHVVARDVIGAVQDPVVMRRAGAATSTSAQRPDAVAEEWGDRVDLILDAGSTRYSKPSTIVRVKPDGYEIERAGVYDKRIIERLLRTTILFVCSGNTCRSPMAEAIARHILSQELHVPESELEKKGISVLSAGSLALPGAKAAPPAVEALKDIGLDLSKHRSRPLTIELVHEADIIFTMSRSHAQAVKALVPSAADKVQNLDPEKDIDDPIGGDYALYSQLAQQLQGLIARRLRDTELFEA